jgi:hypothetical protein
MRTEPEVTRIVRSWLVDGVDRLPDRVLDSVLEAVPATPQRRSWWSAWRRTQMPNFAKLLGGVAAIVLVAVLGWRLLPSNGGIGGATPTAAPTPSPTATPSPTPVPSLNGQGTLQPGRYSVNGGIPGLTVAVPAGWSTDTDWVVIGPSGNDAPTGMAIRFEQVDNVAADPLRVDAGPFNAPLGPTVDDLVQALTTHPILKAGPPTAITIDGHPGQRVEFAIPSDANLGASDGMYCIVLDISDCSIWGWAPGQTFDWFIVDVNGHRLVIDAFHYPGTSAADLAAQQSVVDSVQFGS